MILMKLQIKLYYYTIFSNSLFFSLSKKLILNIFHYNIILFYLYKSDIIYFLSDFSSNTIIFLYFKLYFSIYLYNIFVFLS